MILLVLVYMVSGTRDSPGRANVSLKRLKDSTDRLYGPPWVVSGDETTREGELSRLGSQGNPDRRDNFFSYKHFGSRTRDNSRCEFQVLNHKFTSQKQN